jgi:hypothetical protein
MGVSLKCFCSSWWAMRLMMLRLQVEFRSRLSASQGATVILVHRSQRHFVLAGLIDSRRIVTASQNGRLFLAQTETVEILGENTLGLAFTAPR